MIILMQLGADPALIDDVCAAIRARGHETLVLPGGDRLAIGVPDALDADERVALEGVVARMPGVSLVTQTSRPYKLASIEFHPERTVVPIKHLRIGDGSIVVMAGPCSIESHDQFLEAARVVAESGAPILRGGAFKPRTSPYAFQGLRLEGLRIMREVGQETGLITITEVMSADMVEPVGEHVDIPQIGARSMQNYPLLIEAGRSGKPVFLKRGPGATVDEWLLAAEYMLHQGNPNVILCERGVLALDRSYTRNTLDLGIVPAVKEHTHLPLIVDPSHGVGVARYVPALAKAALVAGADGIMVEMHPRPADALSDGAQALDRETFLALMKELKSLAEWLGLRFATRPD